MEHKELQDLGEFLVNWVYVETLANLLITLEFNVSSASPENEPARKLLIDKLDFEAKKTIFTSIQHNNKRRIPNYNKTARNS